MKHLPREVLFVFSYKMVWGYGILGATDRCLEIHRVRRKVGTAYSTVASFHKKQFEVLIDSGEEEAV